MIAAAAITLAAQRLAAAGIEEPRREARLIAAAAYNTDAAGLLLRDELEMAKIEPLLARREAREPLAYIVGRREFWGLEFEVSPATLIPRPDSETLIEAVLDSGLQPSTILDLGTGTGCLLLAALHEFPTAFGVGVDLAPAAVALAARNAHMLGLGARAAFLAGDWASALEHKFDLILSNPPYIPHADIAGLMPEVTAYEPALALDGGATGLEAYREIIGALPQILAENGLAVLELGVGQAPSIQDIAAQAGYGCVLRRDLSGTHRAALLKLRK